MPLNWVKSIFPLIYLLIIVYLLWITCLWWLILESKLAQCLKSKDTAWPDVFLLWSLSQDQMGWHSSTHCPITVYWAHAVCQLFRVLGKREGTKQGQQTNKPKQAKRFHTVMKAMEEAKWMHSSFKVVKEDLARLPAAWMAPMPSVIALQTESLLFCIYPLRPYEIRPSQHPFLIMMLLKHTKPVLVSGPLHWLCLLPEKLFSC